MYAGAGYIWVVGRPPWRSSNLECKYVDAQSYYNSTDLGLFVCLFHLKISTWQEIGLRRLRGWGRDVLRGVLFA